MFVWWVCFFSFFFFFGLMTYLRLAAHTYTQSHICSIVLFCERQNRQNPNWFVLIRSRSFLSLFSRFLTPIPPHLRPLCLFLSLLCCSFALFFWLYSIWKYPGLSLTRSHHWAPLRSLTDQWVKNSCTSKLKRYAGEYICVYRKTIHVATKHLHRFGYFQKNSNCLNAQLYKDGTQTNRIFVLLLSIACVCVHSVFIWYEL